MKISPCYVNLIFLLVSIFNIDQYFFFKIKNTPPLIPVINSNTLSNSNLNPSLISNCLIQSSDPNYPCLKCIPNYFLLNKQQCLKVCPSEYINDESSSECKKVFKSPNKEDISYIMFNSHGTCKNLCGSKVSSDCSCLPECINEKNCCKDFKHCEILLEKNQFNHGECTIKNCELCEDFTSENSCGKCLDNFYLKNGKCVSNCDSNDLPHLPNKICIINGKICKADNCEQCNNMGNCIKCKKGFYLIKDKNKCTDICEEGYKADNLNRLCVDENLDSMFWKVQSSGRCINKCGNIEGDCSCEIDCKRKGNCCEDYLESCNK